MELKDSEKLIESFKKRPWKTIFAIAVLLILLSVFGFFNGFFGEKGKRAAGLSNEGNPHVEQPSNVLPHERKKAEPRPTINQHTEGDQSPAVNVAPGGQSIIKYSSPKETNRSEGHE